MHFPSHKYYSLLLFNSWLVLCICSLVHPSNDVNNTFAQRNECGSEKDCPPFHYCFITDMTRICKTHFKTDPDNLCRRQTSGDKAMYFPDHEFCQRTSSGNLTYSRSMCFPGNNGYFCANAYYMPCLKHYDGQGNVISGMCPNHFKCQQKQFNVAKKELVCVPDNMDRDMMNDGDSKCETNFECGYSLLTNDWGSCVGGQCHLSVLRLKH